MPLLPSQLQSYLDRGWLIFPCSWRPGDRRPLVAGGFYAGSNDARLVAAWYEAWPLAMWAIRTGKQPQGSGVAIVDVDRQHGGFETLARLLGPEIPAAPTVHSPSGGEHRWHLAPPGGCCSTVGVGGRRRRGPGPGIDIKCDLVMCHVPGPSPRSKYTWDATYNLDTLPLLPLPAVLTPVEVPDDELGPAAPAKRPIGNAAAYAQKAVNNACQRIRAEMPGGQRKRLNDESYSIGRQADGLGLDHAATVRALVEAGLAMVQQMGRPPWRLHEVRDTVLDGFRDGLRKPYAPQLRSARRRG